MEMLTAEDFFFFFNKMNFKGGLYVFLMMQLLFKLQGGHYVKTLKNNLKF